MSDQKPPQDLLDWLGITDSPNWRVAKPLGVLISVLLALLFIGAVLAAFALMGRTILGALNSTAGSLSAGALIVAILGAPFLIWNTVIKQKTVDFQKESHITDRISKAVEQLGAEKTVKRLNDAGKTVETTEPNIEVRIGGLLSLERIAQDSTNYDKGRDHVRVIEILCAYVRENAPASGTPAAPTEHKDIVHYRVERRESDRPRSDVAIALSIIGHRSAAQVEVENSQQPPYRLDLSYSNFCFANFEEQNFSNASFYHSKLRFAFIRKADFSGCNFRHADLLGIRGDEPNFDRSKLGIANLAYSSMQGARIRDCEFSLTDFEAAELTDAHFRFPEPKLYGEQRRAFLKETNLKGVQIEGNAQGVEFNFNDKSACFNHHFVAFRNAILAFSSFRQTDAKETEPCLSFFADASVELSEGIQRPTHWPDWILPDQGPNAFLTQWKLWQSDPDGYKPPQNPTP